MPFGPLHGSPCRGSYLLSVVVLHHNTVHNLLLDVLLPTLSQLHRPVALRPVRAPLLHRRLLARRAQTADADPLQNLALLVGREAHVVGGHREIKNTEAGDVALVGGRKDDAVAGGGVVAAAEELHDVAGVDDLRDMDEWTREDGRQG